MVYGRSGFSAGLGDSVWRPIIRPKNKGSPRGLPVMFSPVADYCGFLCTGGFLTGAGAALVNSAPFSMTITNGLGV